ncbi:MAG: 50S ribosomal protein L6 [Patescibacteria group bacterium]|jgi:large subunit ribosomal protein L6
MSRIGKKPIQIPSGVEVKADGGQLSVNGPKGTLTIQLHPVVNIEIKDGSIFVTVSEPEEKKQRALWGLFRKLIANMIEGVVKGFEKKLEISGVGFRVALQGNKLVFNLGFSHQIEFVLPQGISAVIEGTNVIILNGIDKQLIGETAAKIRKLKKPEPYKGKGIKYAGEAIRRKAGKSGKAA